MDHFMLRAECAEDVDAFEYAVRDASIEVRDWTISKTTGLPDTVLSFRTDASFEVLLEILKAIPNGDLMYETMGYAGRWSGARHDRSP